MQLELPFAVLKYGGTSVASAATWAQIVARVRVLLPTHRVWLVVSAVSKVTNLLLNALGEAVAPALSGEARFASLRAVSAIHEALAASLHLSPAEYALTSDLLGELARLLEGIALTGEVSARLRARVAAYGELLSSAIGGAFLARALGDAAKGGVRRVDSRVLLVSTESSVAGASAEDAFLEADVRPSLQPARAALAAGGASVVIAQGFIASTPDGSTCLLGRGGSDTSGALFAAFTGAAVLEIWTDVNGMFTADPRFVPNARLLRALSYREAQELAAMGARVLHPRCLLPAAAAGVPVEVRNTMDAGDDAECTVITADGKGGRQRGRYAPSSPKLKSQSTPLLPPLDTDDPNFTAMPAQCVGGVSIAQSGASRIIFASGPGGEGGDSGDEASASSSGRESPLVEGAPRSTSPRISLSEGSRTSGRVLAVARRKGVTLVTLSAYDMWGTSGFLTSIFAPFGAAGVSVDLIATSQYAVSVTLDHIPEGVSGGVFRRLCANLSKIATTTVRSPCAVVSVVGRGLRMALPRIGPAMRVLSGVTVHMVAQAAEDLSLSFVVDEEHADDLVAKLHSELLEGDAVVADSQFGPVWSDLPAGKAALALGEAKH